MVVVRDPSIPAFLHEVLEVLAGELGDAIVEAQPVAVGPIVLGVLDRLLHGFTFRYHVYDRLGLNRHCSQ